MVSTEYARIGYGNMVCGTQGAKIDDKSCDLFIHCSKPK